MLASEITAALNALLNTTLPKQEQKVAGANLEARVKSAMSQAKVAESQLVATLKAQDTMSPADHGALAVHAVRYAASLVG
jgi:hypothetical protein